MGGTMPKPSIASSVFKLALAGEQAGFTLDQMIDMLNTGITVASLLGLIEVRLACRQRQQMPAETSLSRWVM